MASGAEGRIYVRKGLKTDRFYGDFRDYSDVGGGQEALIPPGAGQATTDADEALRLAADRLEELKEKRENGETVEDDPESLKAFASLHLRLKARSDVTDQWLETMEIHLDRAVDFFGADRPLSEIRPSDVRAWMDHLRDHPNGRGDTLSEKTVRDHLNSLSNLFRRARSEEAVPSGHGPVRDLMEKPQPERTEADWLEVHEAALLLEAARLYEPPKDKHAFRHLYPLLATFLLTGARRAAVFGLEVEDVSFDRKLVRFRPNEHRRLKTRASDRSVPLWPQLEGILREYVFGGETPRSGLLFRSPRTGGMLTSVRKQLDTVGERCGFQKGEIRTKIFRHTYTAARLQTLDGGHPVSVFTVSRELGHASTSMVERVYSHLGQVRHRSEVVEYRVEQHEEELGERVRKLRAVASAAGV